MEPLAGHSLLGPILPCTEVRRDHNCADPLPAHLAHNRGKNTKLLSGILFLNVPQGQPYFPTGQPCPSLCEGTLDTTCDLHSTSCLPSPG